MARYCGNCGTRLEEDAKVCGQCGTSVDEMLPKIPGEKNADFGKPKKIIKIIVSLAVVAAAAVIALNVISNFTGHKGLLRKVMKAYEEYDIDTLISLSSDVYYYGQEDFVEYYFAGSVGEDLDAYEASVGHSYKLSYEVNEIYTLSARRQSELLSSIELLYPDFDVSVIEKIIVANVTVTAKQGDRSDNRDVNITMTKENGAWKLLYIE